MALSTVSATHRCIFVSEILHKIAEGIYSVGALGTLANLAGTCKAFNEDVIPVLWRRLEGISPLVRLLPSESIISIQNESQAQPVLSIVEPALLEWSRFQFYATHVRELIWKSPKDVDVPSLFSTNDSSPPPLLPQLRVLDWKELRDLDYICYFLTPTLRELCIAPDASALTRSQMIRLFRQASKKCTGLEIIRLPSSREERPSLRSDCGGRASNVLARYLRRVPHLKEFSGRVWLSASCAEAFATLPDLQELEILLTSAEIDALTASVACVSLDKPWFRSLRFLSLTVNRLDWNTAKFFNSIQSDCLANLLIEDHGESDAYMLQRNMAAIASAPYHRALRTLAIRSLPPLKKGLPPALDAGDALRLLYPLPQMRNIAVFAPILAVDSRTVQDIAAAWSSLQSLTLIGYYQHPPSGACLNLHDLAPLAKKCPRLRRLVLHLSATSVPTEETTAELLPNPSRCRLRTLTMHDASIVDPERVAAFLAKVFPKAHEVSYKRSRDRIGVECETLSRFEAHWQRVQAILRDASS
ncbi:hypothetical protein BV20DRAFT_1056042 [Pilatotrama ljubarskyi]|nr:hypothetical protein BV20DRAFT_1056042 [Pilatotrama ljubarskyi]